MNKTKTYIITLSKQFMKGHPREGEKTGFRDKLLLALDDKNVNSNVIKKVHTIRENFPLWEKRIKEVQDGRAILSIRQWSGKPYRSKQEVVCNLTKDSGIGIQKLSVMEYIDNDDDSERAMYCIDNNPRPHLTSSQIALNDGLEVNDWRAWFSKVDLTSNPCVIIHFTSFRY